MINFFLDNNERIIWNFLQRIKSELQNPKISKIAYQTFKKYYSSWYNIFPLIKQYYYVERLVPVVDLIRFRKIKKVLDIGSGCGTEAIFFASLGCHVLGIDLSKERINCAEERKIYYENLLRKRLDVEFKLGSFFDINIQKKFDIIWMLETIHHIEPSLKALKLAHNFLNEGGYIIISEPNGLNPLVQIQLFFKRGILLHKQIFNTKTNKMVPYGNENIFLLWKMRRMLKVAGFKTVKVSYQRFLPYNKLTEKYFQKFKMIEDLLRKMPILKNFAAGYTIVAEKN